MDVTALQNILLGKGGIVIAVLVAVFAAERIFPVARVIGGLRRNLRNLGLSGFNFVLAPFIVIPVTQYAGVHAFDWRPEAWIGWWAIAIDLLVLDLWIYWWHRANHRLPLLWRFHEVHHLDETLDATSALRFHFGEVILSSLVRALVIVALDMPLASVVIFEILVTVTAIFHHSNLRLPPHLEKMLSLFIVTPSIHWVHHHAVQQDTDSSYATVLSLWDRLFASRSATVRTADLPIGVEGRHDQSLPWLVIRPFWRR